MKKIILIFFALFLNAQVLQFTLPSGVETNETNTTEYSINENTADINSTSESNSSLEANISVYEPVTQEEDFNDTYVSLNNRLNIAVVIDKKRFFKYIPSIMNAINAYLAQKGIDYDITLYGKDVNLSDIKSDNVLFFTLDKNDVYSLNDYNKTFYLPLFNKNDINVSYPNVYFGSVNFKEQTDKLTSFIDDKTDIVTDNTLIGSKLLKYESNMTFLNNIYTYPNIYYKDLNNSFVIFNTDAGKTAQVLSKITQKEINTKLNLISQIGYNPLMIMLTQPADVEKLLIANSIINPPLTINENASLLNSDIRYNWLNYAACILINKAYNKQNDEDEFYMSDFNIYIFNNQINYKTQLYRIIDGAFKQVE